MIEALSIRTYDPQDDARLTDSFVECYCRVFADPPWNERWERQAVESMLEKVDRNMSFVACDGGEVIGFAFAQLERLTCLERVLGIEFATEVERRKYGSWHPGCALLQSDLGVLAGYRRRGVGKRLFKSRFEANMQPYQIVRARQFPEPSVTYTWYTEKLGYEVIARYPEEDGRVILFQRGDALQQLVESWES